ncbi:C-type lectin domain-containing protein [Caenorhabditis elegans]|uniref:C-type lectin domain-containing protein n=2 Tax=Caenorhabditis elegans TaxID=6239 RepID=Q95XX2_CAEEL|nr:C-type lectin domain-containing protein [Caenorhabditis elegans]CCD83493.1 C-type lectin domain-containing protein [Caenorhabditis elegans]|eukprot:NP_500262.1 C-type LECtin [Caenorhabditis elegans]
MFRLAFSLCVLQLVFGQCTRPDDKYIGDLCYSISAQLLKFTDAQSACYSQNQNLAVIHTSLQANFLASIVRTQTGSQKFWIGLSRASSSSRFQWDDGTTMYWSNFDMNFPKDNNYVAESTLNGKWQTLAGQKELPYVCSYDPKYFTAGPPGSTPNYGSTGYPVSYPVSGATEYPASSMTDSPASGATGYPASGATGYPVSGATGYPVSGATGYPASSMTDSPASGATDYPASGATGYPASGATGYPASSMTDSPASGATGYPASGATDYSASGAPVSAST